MATNTLPPPTRRGTASRSTPRPGNGPAAQQPQSRSLKVGRGVSVGAQRIVIYGPGGVGKTELCANLQAIGINPLVIDVEDGSRFLDVSRIDPLPETFDEVRQVLHDQSILDEFDAVAIDSLTRLEELAVQWTLANVKHEKGHAVSSIEGYGFGKGYTHVYETFLKILGDLDAVIRSGKHVICTVHDCTANVPNPAGVDWIRYEPRLQAPASGKASIRSRVREWCDHLLYIGYDLVVDQDGKAVGSGTRTIYPVEWPTHLAKSRSLSDPIVYERGSAEIWNLLLKPQKGKV